MSKPIIHARSSAKKFGGKEEDYLPIHDFFDQTKSHFPTNAHRAILHSSFGIFLIEKVFGHEIVNSDNKKVSVRDIGEQHILEDLGFIPTVADYLSNMEYKPWMHGEGKPPSMEKYEEKGCLFKVPIENESELDKGIFLDGSNFNYGEITSEDQSGDILKVPKNKEGFKVTQCYTD